LELTPVQLREGLELVQGAIARPLEQETFVYELGFGIEDEETPSEIDWSKSRADRE
jgi:hypothetical protein